MTQQTIQILLEIVLLVIGVYLAFFKTYSPEKNKNLATLEVIEEIASKTQLIKTQFAREIEKVTPGIQSSAQSEVSVVVEKMKNKLDDLKKELDEINDRSGFEKFMEGLFGADGGAGDVGEAENSYLRHQLAEVKAKFLLVAVNYENIKCLNC